jgi:hypothetical protein
MIYIALAGMTKHVIKELQTARVRTVEIRSPYNFFALQNVQAGDKIFLTDSSAPDIVPGTCGLVASVRAIQTITHRLIQSTQDYYEESEAQASRAQLQFIGIGRVRNIASVEKGLPLALEVDEVKYCDAR